MVVAVVVKIPTKRLKKSTPDTPITHQVAEQYATPVLSTNDSLIPEHNALWEFFIGCGIVGVKKSTGVGGIGIGVGVKWEL